MMNISRVANWFLASLVVAYSFLFKTFPISEQFWWLGDQIRDWSIVQSDFFSLPGHGTPRVDGYYSIGPAYYWTLWMIRVLIGPFFEMLPHAGGYGISLLNALSDGALVLALLSLGFERLLVLAFGLILVSSPMESSLAGVIWNPPVAVTFIQFAIAACLFAKKSFSTLRLIIITILAFFALQSHTPVAILAFCILCFAALEYHRTQSKSWFHIAVVLGLTSFLVELRYLIYFWAYGPKVAGTTVSVIDSSIQNLLHFNSTGLARSYHLVKFVFQTYVPEISVWFFILGSPALFLFFRKKIRNPTQFFLLGLAPILITAFAVCFSTQTLEQYFFISLGAPLLLIPLFLSDALMSSWNLHRKKALSVIFFILALMLQTQRWESRSQKEVLPEYGAMVRACKELRSKHLSLSDIEGPPTSRPTCAKCLFKLLGGKIDPFSKYTAKIERNGSVAILETENLNL